MTNHPLVDSKVSRVSSTGRPARIESGSGSTVASSSKSQDPEPSGSTTRPLTRPRPRPRPRLAQRAPSPALLMPAPAETVLDLDPPSPTKTEVLEDDMTELEAATSSFVLDDQTDLDITSPSTSPFTRSKQVTYSSKVACDPVLASYAGDNDNMNPFAGDYAL